MKICYFTATGNSLYVSRHIGGDLLSIPHLMKTGEMTVQDDAVGIVCPVYCGEMPKIVREFVMRARIITGYFFFICTYGLDHSVSFVHARELADQAGLKLDYVNAVKMADNYLPGFEMQNQINTLAEKNIEGQLTAICHDIRERNQSNIKITAGLRLRAALIHSTMAKMILKNDAAQSYIVNDQCVRCGVCAKICPKDNITVKDRVIFSDCCEVCYACVHNCPRNAIHLKNEKSAVRFRNEHVSLQDIIAANE